MAYMFEVLTRSPLEARREATISAFVGGCGGQLTCREEPDAAGAGPVCLTYEFDDRGHAERAADRLRELGEHVEGPVDYGDD